MDSQEARAAFLALFLQSEREIFRYVAAMVPHHVDAEDIVQQTALALWEKFDDYDRAKPFVPWACRFALNKTRQWVEKQQRWQALLDGGLGDELLQQRTELSEDFEHRFKYLGECLSKLPESQRTLIEGYYYRRQEVESLAAGIGSSVDAVYKSLQRIRRTLQACVDRAMAGEERTA